MKLFLCLIVLFASSAFSQTTVEIAAASDLDSLKTWKDLESWRLKYAPKYDDGFYAEGIADFVERQLAENWQVFPLLISETSKSPELFNFVVSHIGEITTCTNAKIILGNAKHNCPLKLAVYCNKIYKKLKLNESSECVTV